MRIPKTPIGLPRSMTGTCRNWIHYIELRSANGTQKEHQDVALGCKKIFCDVFPDVATAMEWNDET